MKQILCFGDSNTWGLVPGKYERYAWGVRWTSILQEKLKDRDIRIIEDGIVGRTSVFDDKNRPYRNGEKELPRSLEMNDCLDAVILMLGTNDCKTEYGAEAEDIGKGIEVLIRQIKEHDPSTRIILVSPIHLGEEVYREEFDPEFNAHSIEKSKELKLVYRKIAKQYGLESLAASDYAMPSKRDMEHMDPEGHKNLAEAMYRKVLEVLMGAKLAA